MPRGRDSHPEKALGQLLVIGFDGTAMSPRLAVLLDQIQPAGVILFARNIVNPQQTHRLLKECRARVSQPLFTCVDLEGGRVDRFRGVFGATPSAAEVFATGRPQLYRRHGLIVGRACRALGFNLDLAPVLDLAFEASRAVMSSRAFSTQPEEVIAYAREFLAGLKAAGVLGAGKHFPGLGEGTLDSHYALPVIKKPFSELWAEDLAPYRRMQRELPIVLISHANYPAVTGDRLPASLSKKWITDVLRRRIGFRGLVASDDMEMGALLKTTGMGEAAVQFVAAGGDLCLVCHQQEQIESAYAAIESERRRSPSFRRRVGESIARVAAFKRRHAAALRSAPAPATEKAARISRELWEFSERVRLHPLSSAAQAGGTR